MATIKRVNATAQKVTGYKIDFATNSLIMNYKFAAAAEQYGTKENRLVMNIRKDFPNLTVVVQSGRQQKTAHKNKRLTYENMKSYISVNENAEELLEVFETVKATSVTKKSPYSYVCNWFKAQFPDYDKTPVYQNGKLTVLPEKAPEIRTFKVKLSA